MFRGYHSRLKKTKKQKPGRLFVDGNFQTHPGIWLSSENEHSNWLTTPSSLKSFHLLISTTKHASDFLSISWLLHLILTLLAVPLLTPGLEVSDFLGLRPQHSSLHSI